MPARRIVTVTLNPSVDLVVSAPGFRAGVHTLAARVGETPSGKGVNVSRVLALLGVRSIATGLLGRTEVAMYAEHFRKECAGRVTPRFVPVASRTRTTITIVGAAGERDTHLREPGPKVTPADAARARKFVSALATRGSIVAICGSAPPGVAPGAVGALVAGARRRGAFVAVDTSGEALRAAHAAGPTLLKVNAEELGALVGARVVNIRSAALAAQRALRGNTRAVVVTLGANGAVLVLADQPDALHARCPLPKKLVRNTVGCGDALLAGMLQILSENPDAFERALLRGVAAATASAADVRTAWLDPGRVPAFEREIVLASV